MRIPIKINTLDKAVQFVEDCETYNEDVNLHYRHFVLDAKSLMSVLACDLLQPMEVEIITHDETIQQKFKKNMEKYK